MRLQRFLAVEIFFERVLRADALGFAIRDDFTRVDAARELPEVLRRSAEPLREPGQFFLSDIADGVQPVALENLFGLLADAPQSRDRQRLQELPRGALGDHVLAMGLREVTGD